MFSLFNQCSHPQITPEIKAGYCPDCGEYVENHWYITKCKCCGNKQITVIRGGFIVPLNRFCKNCGSHKFVVEEIETPDIVTINYATVKKVSQTHSATEVLQTWIEKNTPQSLKLIPCAISS